MKNFNQSQTGGLIFSDNSGILGSNNIIGGSHNSSINVNIPEKGYQKIINSEGKEVTIESNGLNLSNIGLLETENKELKEELKQLHLKYDNLKDEHISLLKKLANIDTQFNK